MSLGNRYHVMFSGGLGDVIWSYFTNWYWLRFPSLKARFPEVKLDLIISSHNSQSPEIARFCPYFDRIFSHEYGAQLEVETKPLNALSMAEFSDNKIPIFLSKEEQYFVSELKSPYIAIHPFAGDQNRNFVNLVNLAKLANVVYPIRLVILGGNHRRFDVDSVESFDVDHPGVYNLVGRANPRLSVEIVRRSFCFIGTHSCYLMAAWALGVKALCIAPGDLLCYLANPGKITTPYIDHLFKDGNMFMSFEELPFIDRFLKVFFSNVLNSNCQGPSSGYKQRVHSSTLPDIPQLTRLSSDLILDHR